MSAYIEGAELFNARKAKEIARGGGQLYQKLDSSQVGKVLRLLRFEDTYVKNPQTDTPVPALRAVFQTEENEERSKILSKEDILAMEADWDIYTVFEKTLPNGRKVLRIRPYTERQPEELIRRE